MYVILHPHSITNPTKKYCVVNSQEWNAFATGACKRKFTVSAEYIEYKDAEAKRNELNRDAAR